jgi:hypothetical protein
MFWIVHLEYVWFSTSHNPMDFHGLLQRLAWNRDCPTDYLMVTDKLLIATRTIVRIQLPCTSSQIPNKLFLSVACHLSENLPSTHPTVVRILVPTIFNLINHSQRSTWNVSQIAENAMTVNRRESPFNQLKIDDRTIIPDILRHVVRSGECLRRLRITLMCSEQFLAVCM